MRQIGFFAAALVAILTAPSLSCAATAKAPPPSDLEARALWVTRWDFETPEDIRAIARNAAAHHFNILLFQVRGEATAFYRSRFEPWAWELTGKDPSTLGRDPGWDPLATAISEAHAVGLELHAYMNVLPAWKNPARPAASAKHVLTEHPDWLMAGRDGKPMPIPDGFYTFLNPAHPDVKRHLIQVFDEVAANYSVDGIHLDYIRYPVEYRNGDLSYDPVSLELFRRESGLAPQDDAEAWRRFRVDQVNDLVHRIYAAVKARKPNLMVSAACVANYEEALQDHKQDSIAWVNGGYMDCLMPMNYTAKMDLFQRRAEVFARNWRRGLLYMGIQADRGAEAVRAEVQYARKMRAHGVALFSYGDLFPNHQPSATARMLKDDLFVRPARVAGRRYAQ